VAWTNPAVRRGAGFRQIGTRKDVQAVAKAPDEVEVNDQEDRCRELGKMRGANLTAGPGEA